MVEDQYKVKEDATCLDINRKLSFRIVISLMAADKEKTAYQIAKEWNIANRKVVAVRCDELVGYRKILNMKVDMSRNGQPKVYSLNYENIAEELEKKFALFHKNRPRKEKAVVLGHVLQTPIFRTAIKNNFFSNNTKNILLPSPMKPKEKINKIQTILTNFANHSIYALEKIAANTGDINKKLETVSRCVGAVPLDILKRDIRSIYKKIKAFTDYSDETTEDGMLHIPA